MTPKQINALPRRVRDYIHWIEATCDPAGIIQENFRLTQENRALRKLVTKLLRKNPRNNFKNL